MAGAEAALELHLTPAERAARGKAARAKTPRSSQSALDVARGRDPVALLESQARSRLAELVPIRYGRMLASPLAFFRGNAVVMAHDLAPTPTAGLSAQLCGDAHLQNFGGFASPERDLVFDLNDFDETRVRHTLLALDSGDDLLRAGHLRDELRIDEEIGRAHV